MKDRRFYFPMPIARKEWLVVVLGLAIALIVILALVSQEKVFLFALIIALGGVCYRVYKQIEETNDATRTLFESEQRFRLLVEEVCDYAIFGLDPLGNVMSWNTGAQQMMWYSPAVIRGQHFAKLVIGVDAGGVDADALLAKAAKEGRVQLEAHFVRQDGSRYLTNTVITPLGAADGQLRGFSVIASDITARKQAEKELLDSHRFIQQVTATLPDLLFIVHPKEEELLFINKESSALLGYSEETLQKLGKGLLLHLVHPEDGPWVRTLGEQCAKMKDGEVFQFEARLRNAMDEWRWFNMRAVVFSRETVKSPMQTLCLAQDLTMLKRAQDDLYRIEQIALSRERLALLGELSASVAHEFRNPLLGVQHCVEELRTRCGSDPNIKAVVDLLEEGLLRMDHVSGRLLKMARSDSGMGVLSDIGPCIEGTCGFVRSHAQRAGVQLHAQVEPNLPMIPLCAERISEALLNLIYNAIDACPNGGSVFVRARKSSAEQKIEIQVSDTGTGVANELREKIFETFFTTKMNGRGTGLGMTIVKRIVDAHCGSIELLPQTDKGTTFRILLPMTECEAKSK